MAVQFDQITEISSEAKNEMNCDSESGSLPLSQPKSSERGRELSIISGHFITERRVGADCRKQSGPFLPHPGVECEGQFDRLPVCPGLSYYHLRGMLKGSKSPPLVCYPLQVKPTFSFQPVTFFSHPRQNASFPSSHPCCLCYIWPCHGTNEPRNHHCFLAISPLILSSKA